MSMMSKIISEITQHLMETEYKRLQAREIELVQDNARQGGAPDGFLYRGVLYSDLETRLRAKGKRGNLHPSLTQAMDLHLADKAAVEFDRTRIRQALALVLQECKTPQDVRDALPNALAEVPACCRGLERTRPEAYTLADNPKASSQYQRLREKIDFYVAAKLLY